MVYLIFHFSQHRPEGIAEVISTSCSQLYPSVNSQLCSICAATALASSFRRAQVNSSWEGERMARIKPPNTISCREEIRKAKAHL